jgi:hypothetical protein
MFSHVCNEIKKKCFNNQNQIKPLSEKLIEPLHIKEPEQKQKKISYPNNKLISCYEEDYTRNITEIMKLWQRN